MKAWFLILNLLYILLYTWRVKSDFNFFHIRGKAKINSELVILNGYIFGCKAIPKMSAR